MNQEFRDQWIESFIYGWCIHRERNYSTQCLPEHWTHNEKGLLNKIVNSRDGYLEAVQFIYMASGNKLKEFDCNNLIKLIQEQAK
jgi:hypothetical protein